MAASLTRETLRLLRQRSQGLAGSGATTVPDAVRSAGAVQAQASVPARLAVRARSRRSTAETVTRACNEERSVVRTWLLRGTLHMVPAEDVGWMVALLGPVVVAATRRRRLQLGLTDDLLADGLKELRDILGSQGPLPRAELIRQVAAKGLEIGQKGQAGPHLVSYAAMRGVVCRGPDLDADVPTYVLLEDWCGAQPERDEDDALSELARRHIRAYGPSTAKDFAAWSGLKTKQARQGFASVAGEFEDVEVDGEPALTTHTEVERGVPVVRLIPNFDGYLLGYRSRDLVLAPEFAKRIHPGGGWLHPAVLVDGRVVGVWRLSKRAVTVEPFERLDPATRTGIEAEVEDIGRFLGSDIDLAVERP